MAALTFNCKDCHFSTKSTESLVQHLAGTQPFDGQVYFSHKNISKGCYHNNCTQTDLALCQNEDVTVLTHQDQETILEHFKNLQSCWNAVIQRNAQKNELKPEPNTQTNQISRYASVIQEHITPVNDETDHIISDHRDQYKNTVYEEDKSFDIQRFGNHILKQRAFKESQSVFENQDISSNASLTDASSIHDLIDQPSLGGARTRKGTPVKYENMLVSNQQEPERESTNEIDHIAMETEVANSTDESAAPPSELSRPWDYPQHQADTPRMARDDYEQAEDLSMKKDAQEVGEDLTVRSRSPAVRPLSPVTTRAENLTLGAKDMTVTPADLTVKRDQTDSLEKAFMEAGYRYASTHAVYQTYIPPVMPYSLSSVVGGPHTPTTTTTANLDDGVLRFNWPEDMEKYASVLVKDESGSKLRYRCSLCPDYSTTTKHRAYDHVDAKHFNRKRHACDVCDFRTTCFESLRQHITRRVDGICPGSGGLSGHPRSPAVSTTVTAENEVPSDPNSSPVHRSASPMFKLKFQQPDNVELYESSMQSCQTADAASKRKSVFKCNRCNFTCQARSRMFDHLDAKHFGVKRHACDRCDFRSSSYESLRNHVLSRDETGTCPGGPVTSDPPSPVSDDSVPSPHPVSKSHTSLSKLEYLPPENTEKYDELIEQCDPEMCADRNKRLKCKLCDFRTGTKRRMYDHIDAKHFHLKRHGCDSCSFRSACLESLRNHILARNEGSCPGTTQDQVDVGMESEEILKPTNTSPVQGAKVSFKLPENLEMYENVIRRIGGGNIDRSKLQCGLCSFSTIARHRMFDHLDAKHFGLKRHVCDQCDFKSSSLESLRNHVAARLCDGRCPGTSTPEPDLTTDDGSDLNLSASQKLPALSYSPPKNAQEYEKFVKKDISADLKNKLQCKLCNFHTGTKHRMYDHLDGKHFGRRRHKCDKCSFATATIESLRNHILARIDGQCPGWSGQTETSPQVQIKESSVKSGGRITFIPPADLDRYEMIIKRIGSTDPATKRRTMVCTLCNFSTIIKHRMLDHIDGKHFMRKRHRCDTCDFRTNRLESLRNHVAGHASERDSYLFDSSNVSKAVTTGANCSDPLLAAALADEIPNLPNELLNNNTNGPVFPEPPVIQQCHSPSVFPTPEILNSDEISDDADSSSDKLDNLDESSSDVENSNHGNGMNEVVEKTKTDQYTGSSKRKMFVPRFAESAKKLKSEDV